MYFFIKNFKCLIKKKHYIYKVLFVFFLNFLNIDFQTVILILNCVIKNYFKIY